MCRCRWYSILDDHPWKGCHTWYILFQILSKLTFFEKVTRHFVCTNPTYPYSYRLYLVAWSHATKLVLRVGDETGLSTFFMH